ncbi:MAG: Gfo/Idh/MocA family oxidoreductase [Verrucomicrobia bacterium]|nr:Gfo/Idh/MocA family oxidoreductase [Verrucomicrobiota bacterium]
MTMITRGSFMKQSLIATAGVSLPWTWARAAGANDTIRVGIIGFGGRGREHISALRKVEGVKIVALCDVDAKILAKGVAEFEKRGEKVTAYNDPRKLMEDKDIDAVSTATPNHWHALLTVWACQAGKDIYVEKPAAHSIWEGRQAVKAAAKYKRIVQVGSQSRSSQGIREAVAFIRKGGLGKIKLARGLCYKRRKSIGKAEGSQPIPEGLDYNLWSGPAELVPPHRNGKFGAVHYDWHWIWRYGNGDLGNQGVHQVDIGRWFLGEKTLAPQVMSIGGRLGYEDDGETPNTQIMMLDYEKAPLIFEVRGLASAADTDNMDKYWPVKFTPAPQKAAAKAGKAAADMRSVTGGRSASDPRSSIGVIIHCENGFVSIPSYTQADIFDNDGKEIPEYKGKFKGADSHFENFIKAVRSRKTSDLNAPILEGHLSAGLCHQGNIAYRVGKKASPGEIREQVKGNQVVSEAFGRMCEHLAANGVDLAKTPAAISAWLKFDTKKEQFVDNEAANALVKDKYREPFVVPAIS